MVHAPRSNFLYSDIASNILGHVIAQVSGELFEAYVQNHILDPLGFDQTTFLMPEEDDTLAIPHESGPTGEAVIAPAYPYNRIHAPSSGLVTSVDELLQWALVGMNRGERDGVRVVSAEAYDEMWMPHASTGMAGWEHYGPAMSDYGLGWYLGTIGDQMVVEHMGGDLGFNSNMIFVPEKGLAVVAASNLYDGGGMAPAILAPIDIMYELLGVEE